MDKPRALRARKAPIRLQQELRRALCVAKTSSRTCSERQIQRFASAVHPASGHQQALDRAYLTAVTLVSTLLAQRCLAEASDLVLFALFPMSLLRQAVPRLPIALVKMMLTGSIQVAMGSQGRSIVI